jgi:hypothetical protein
MNKRDLSSQISFSISQAARVTGFHRNTIGRAIKQGALIANVLGNKRVVILRSNLDLWLGGLPEYRGHSSDVPEKAHTGKRGVQDFVQAYMWIDLAAAGGQAGATERRELIAAKLTASEIAEAQQRARDRALRT